jgi:surface antigen
MTKIRLLFVALSLALLLPVTARPALADTNTSPDQQVKDAQAKLLQLNDQVDRANADMDKLNRKLDDDKKREGDLNQELSDLARLQYKVPVPNVTTILGAQTLNQLLSDISESRLVARKQRDLLNEATKLRQQDEKARNEMAKKLNDIKSARDDASKVLSQALALRNSQLAAQARSLVSPSAPAGPWPNHFSYGYCTWYVANKRYAPWFGNAGEWYANAQPYGFAEGPTPKVAAIMVANNAPIGHVAYVESVNADGSFVVSEMNYKAWNMVDYRTISSGSPEIIGFIY